MNCSWKYGLISLIVLAATIYTVSSISCYVCNSREDPECDTNPADTARNYLKDCKELKDGAKFDRCRKINQWVDFEVDGLKPHKRVIRSCGWNQTNERYCYYRAGFGGRQEVCTCNVDQCNGASYTGLTTFTLLSTVCICILNQLIAYH